TSPDPGTGTPPLDRRPIPGPASCSTSGTRPCQLFDVRYQETGTGRRTTPATWHRTSNDSRAAVPDVEQLPHSHGTSRRRSSMSPLWIGTSWKMTKTLAEGRAWAEGLRDHLASEHGGQAPSGVQPFVIPSFTATTTVRSVL